MPAKRMSPDDSGFFASAREVEQDQRQSIAEWCDRLATGDRGGVRVCADGLLALAVQRPDLGVEAIDRLSLLVRSCEDDYNANVIPKTTMWEVALGAVTNLAAKFLKDDDSKWERVAHSLAFFAAADHAGQAPGHGGERVNSWLEELAYARPQLIEKVRAYMAVPEQPDTKVEAAGGKYFPALK